MRVNYLLTTNVSCLKEKNLYETILHRIDARMNNRILVGTFGAMKTNDDATQGYYLVEWLSESYTVQDNTVIKGVDPQQTSFTGEIINGVVFWYPVSNATD